MTKPREPDSSLASDGDDRDAADAKDKSDAAELHQVRVDMASVHLLDEPEDEIDPEAESAALSLVESGLRARTSEVDALWGYEPPTEVKVEEIPVLGPEHEVSADEVEGKVPSARIIAPVTILDPIENVPVLGSEHELPLEEIPVLGPEPELPLEEIPVLGPEHELSPEEIPVLGPEHELPLDEIPVLGPEHELSPEEIPVLGPEHELTVEEAEGKILSARIIERIDDGAELDEAIPVLGPEHELSPEEIPALGPEHELPSEEIELAVAKPDVKDLVRSFVESDGDEEPKEESDASQREAGDEGEALEATGEPEAADEPEATDDPEASDEPSDETADAAARNYRQIYETEFRDMERDARVAAAHTAEGPRLMALCLDADPHVINAVFQNSSAGLDHARMAAFHHKNPVGLEFIVKRAEFARDTQVQRQLLRNNQMSESLMRRILGNKPLRDVYKVCVDREVPDRNRVWSRGILRARFAQSQAEDRASLVISTEGRCLTFLVGQTFDSRTTSILCGKQYNSVLFIQNLARFPACPPPLLVHLLKQPFVRRHQALKRMILQHPNLPSQAKRNL